MGNPLSSRIVFVSCSTMPTTLTDSLCIEARLLTFRRLTAWVHTRLFVQSVASESFRSSSYLRSNQKRGPCLLLLLLLLFEIVIRTVVVIIILVPNKGAPCSAATTTRLAKISHAFVITFRHGERLLLVALGSSRPQTTTTTNFPNGHEKYAFCSIQ